MRVRYGETDRMGVVYHGEYLAWLDEARTELLRALGYPYDRLEAEGTGLVVRKADLRYRSPARFGDDVRVRVTVERVRGASLLLSYRLERVGDDHHLADAQTELAAVTFGLEPVRPTPIPEGVRRALEAAISTRDADA
ncbi:MAG: thioesterase family protein [Planctomycetota bacterium]